LDVPLHWPLDVPLHGPLDVPLHGPLNVPLHWALDVPLHWPLDVPLHWALEVPLHWPLDVPLHWPLNVPLHWPLDVPLHWPLNVPLRWPLNVSLRWPLQCATCSLELASPMRPIWSALPMGAIGSGSPIGFWSMASCCDWRIRPYSGGPTGGKSSIRISPIDTVIPRTPRRVLRRLQPPQPATLVVGVCSATGPREVNSGRVIRRIRTFVGFRGRLLQNPAE
jgi:hypothetical protein